MRRITPSIAKRNKFFFSEPSPTAANRYNPTDAIIVYRRKKRGLKKKDRKKGSKKGRANQSNATKFLSRTAISAPFGKRKPGDLSIGGVFGFTRANEKAAKKMRTMDVIIDLV